MLHQLVGILGLQGVLLLEETDTRFEEPIVQLDFSRGIFLAIWLPLLRFTQSLDQLFYQRELSLCLQAPLLARLYLDKDANQVIDLLNDVVTSLELSKGYW